MSCEGYRENGSYPRIVFGESPRSVFGTCRYCRWRILKKLCIHRKGACCEVLDLQVEGVVHETDDPFTDKLQGDGLSELGSAALRHRHFDHVMIFVPLTASVETNPSVDDKKFFF